MIKRTVPASSMSSNMIGALSETEVLFLSLFQGKRVLRSILVPPDIGEPCGFLEFFWQTALSLVWVMPGTTLSRLATCVWFEQANPNWVIVPYSAQHASTRPSCVVFWPRGSSQWGEARRLTLLFPEHAGWNWVLPDARSLLATVTYLDQALGRSVLDSPELVARQLLDELTHGQPPSWLHFPQGEKRLLTRQDEPLISMMEQAHDLVWMRPLTLTEQRQRYLHKYIHLSWPLEACLAVQLGGGTPEYSANGRAYDGMRPGIWCVHAERAGSIFDGKQLPSSLESEWMSTPQVKCCQDLSYQISVQEGYYWSPAHMFLKPWAEALWQAAEHLYTHPQHYRHAQGRENTWRAIKHLAHLGMAIIVDDEHKGGWNRPDWWAQIAGRGRALLFAHQARLARKGKMPILVAHDALWLVSDNPNPLTALPDLVTDRKWRGYRVGYEVPLPLSREVQATLRTTEDPNQVAMALDTLAGEDFL